MILKIFFIFSRHIYDDYRNILHVLYICTGCLKNIVHVPQICTGLLKKYSSCSLDMCRMMIKIFFMFTRYVQYDYKNILDVLHTDFFIVSIFTQLIHQQVCWVIYLATCLAVLISWYQRQGIVSYKQSSTSQLPILILLQNHF